MAKSDPKKRAARRAAYARWRTKNIEAARANSRRWVNTAAGRKSAAISKQRYRTQANAYIDEYLQRHACIDCGECDPIVLEFDHRDPAQKEFAISRLRTIPVSFARLKKEIAKCDVRCANCHRRKTIAKKDWKGAAKPATPRSVQFELFD